MSAYSECSLKRCVAVCAAGLLVEVLNLQWCEIVVGALHSLSGVMLMIIYW